MKAPEGYVGTDARYFVSVTYDTQVIGIKAKNMERMTAYVKKVNALVEKKEGKLLTISDLK